MNGWMVKLGVEKLHPHPDNPRKELGDLSELLDGDAQSATGVGYVPHWATCEKAEDFR